ncbi:MULTISPECIES: helix-turn-helix transcriptional regulator [unclassified Streptomyces]|uniref:helix-turn-helix domain-containing protein n=1 Tax=unclassified Streptomyces TaxID=2593676 RepID=UPI0033A1A12E
MAINTAAMFARQRFGQELKKVREATRVNGARIKQIHVAQAMGLTRYDRYSRLERGESWPSDTEWKAIVKCLCMDLETRVRLETMRTEGMSIASAWWTEFADEFPESLIEFVAYEDAAQKITTCAGNLVPGLLQTPDYGRAVTSTLSKTTLSTHLVERSVELRSNRRRVFNKDTPPVVEAIIGEGALQQKVGGTEAMREQLDSLIADVTQHGVTIRVIPFSAPATLTYFFHMFEFGGTSENPVAAFDAMTGMSFEKRTREIRGIRALLDSSKELSLTPEESLEAIQAARKELSRD